MRIARIRTSLAAARARTSRIKAERHEPISKVACFTIVLILPLPEVGVGVSCPLGGLGISRWENAEYAEGNDKQRPDFVHTTNTLQQRRSA